PSTIGAPSVVVAVIDTGVDLGHPDLAGVTVVAPRNETFNTTDVTDEIGHGTHVTGTIFARTDNATGIAGIAPASALMPIKVLDGAGSGFFSDVLDGVDWARTHGADVINLSLGSALSPEQIALFQPTFSAARAAGILVVAAAGNSANAMMYYPAGLNGVVSVAAVDALDVEAEFSTFNRAVDLAAPGVETLSTVPIADDSPAYERLSGTSMASPHVAGVAALVWADRPGLAVAELEAVLRASATDLGTPGRDDHFGNGRVDAAAALVGAVPVPLPDLDPVPGPPGPFTVQFTAPVAPVSQVSASFTVAWTTSHEAIDGLLVRLVWPLVHGGVCPSEDEFSDYQILAYLSPTDDTGLESGFCYRYEVLAIDENSEFADAISEPVTIVDHSRPRIKSRAPRPGAGEESAKASPRVVFSEPVSGASSTTLRLKNLATGRWVRIRVRYDARTSTATIDPVLWMLPGRRYAIYASPGIRDGSGNRLLATHWSFTTKR
ncbi:MAG: S8 family serine peptidase, partial [Chloroflexota bacterium]|nr:S8 family serine peptidase [Chloroflexota bacterium]